jgi:hypothetical protein
MIGWFAFCLIAGLSEPASDQHLTWIVLGVICAAGSLADRTGPEHQAVIAQSPRTLAPRPPVGRTALGS